MYLPHDDHVIAICYEIRRGDLSAAKEEYTKALGIDRTCVKALYRRGVASLRQGDPDGAKWDLREAARRDPQNREVCDAMG